MNYRTVPCRTCAATDEIVEQPGTTRRRHSMRYLALLSLLIASVVRSAFAQGTQIPIVTNEKPLWAKGKEWRVAERPLLDIGKAEAEPQYELSQVRGMLRLADGTIVVANQQNELRYYDKTGKYIRTAGRKGDGPGEFFQI